MTKLLGILLAFLWFFAVIQSEFQKYSVSIPVLFPYQSRFNSDLSPFFLSLALGEKGGCSGGATEVLLDLPPISLL